MRCCQCGDEMPVSLDAIVDHLRVMHPDDYDELEWWPDGGLVIREDLSELTADDVLGEA